MEIPHHLAAYLAVAVLTISISIGLLLITKVPVIVVLCSAIIVAVLYLLYARINTGYWDTFAAISFFVVLIYAGAVSFVLLGIGRFLRWPLFVRTEGQE
jgi:hypothetical protein